MICLALLLLTSPDYGELHCGFLSAKDRIIVGLKPGAQPQLPMEPMERLFLVTRNGRLMLHSPSDLKGKIKISQGSQALQFVRLFTTGGTWWMGTEPCCVEVIAASRIDKNYTLGNDFNALLAKEETGLDGVVSDKWANQLHSGATVRRVPSGFEVSRLLFEQVDQMRGKLKRVTEEVGRNGSFRVLKTKYEKMPGGIHLFFGLFE